MRNKRLLPFMALAVTTLSCTVGAETVTFSAPAGSAKSVLAGLAKKLNLELEVSKPLQWSVILVQVKDMDRELLFKKIADVTSGEWEKTDKGYRLNLSAVKDREDQKRELTFNVASLKTTIEQARLSKEVRESPGGSSLLDILQVLDPSEVASIRVGCRKVLSFTPRSRQYQMPESARAHFVSLLAQRQASPVPSKVWFVVQRKRVDCLELKLAMVDGEGKQIQGANQTITWKNAIPPVNIILTNPKEKIVLDETTLSYLKAMVNPNVVNPSRIFARGMSLKGMGGEFYDSTPQPFMKEAAPRALLDELSNPVEFDPLRRGASEALSLLARSQNFNIVGCLPDTCLLDASSDLQSDGLTAESVARFAIQNWHLDLSSDQGVLLVTPSFATSARLSRFDRLAMKQVIDVEQKNGLVTFSDFLDYFAAQPCEPANIEIEYAWFRLAHPRLANQFIGIYGNSNRFLVSIYAQMSRLQRQAMMSGKTISIQSLSDAQKAILERLIATGESADINSEFKKVLESKYGPAFQSQSMECDLTELLNPSYRSDAQLSVLHQTKPIVMGVDRAGNRIPSDVEGSVTALRNMDEWLVLGEPTKYPDYQLGERTMILFTIPLTPDVSYSAYFVDDQCKADAKQLTFERLPKEYRDWFDLMVKTAKSERERVKQLEDPPSGSRS